MNDHREGLEAAGIGRGVRFAAALLFLILFSGCATWESLPVPLPKEAVRPVVAVSSFENRSGFPGEWQLGGGMADLLVSELVLSKNFEVVERQHLETVVGELQRQKNEMFRPEGRLESGRLKNAQYLIRGVINDFSQVGGGAFAVTIRRLLFGGKGCNARVSLTLTIVDIETGVIVSSVQCKGTSRAREAYVEGSYKGVAFGGDAFFKTPLGQATRDAIRQGLKGIIREMPRRHWKPVIASVADGRIILNGGRDRGFREGRQYVVREAAQPVTDPTTGDLLTLLPGKEVGAIKVVKVEEEIAYAEAVKGEGFRRGQYLTEE